MKEWGWIGFQIDRFGLKKCMNCGFLRYIKWIRRFWKHSGLWISYEFWRGFRIVPVLMFGSWVLNLDHISLFSLGRFVNEFIQIISFFERSSFKLRCGTVIGIVLCYSRQAGCLLYYLCEINNDIHIYQFLHFCFHIRLWFRIWTKILADRRIWWKKGTDREICIPLFTPLIKEQGWLRMG